MARNGSAVALSMLLLAVTLAQNGAAALTTQKPLDLVTPFGRDSNHFPFNPAWAYQTTEVGVQDAPAIDAAAACGGFRLLRNGTLNVARCTNDTVTFDRASLYRGVWLRPTAVLCSLPQAGLGLTSLHGHLNWEPVTYQGNVYFQDYQGTPADDDYDFFLRFPAGGAQPGYVLGNTPGHDNDGLTLELKRSETLGRTKHDWFSELDNEVVAAGERSVLSDGSARPYRIAHRFDGKTGVAIGLLGIDTQHVAHVELHPVYALAVNTFADQSRSQWEVFARNYGSEGQCSNEAHNLPLPQDELGYFQLNVDLPVGSRFEYISNAPGTEFFAENTTPRVTVNDLDAKKKSVVFRLLEPEAGSLIYGRITFCSRSC